MTSRRTSPKPAEPERARSPQPRRKPKHEPVTPESRSNTEKDVARLIHGLAELTQDLRAARSVAMRAAPRTSRSRSRPLADVPTMPPPFSHPRGNPLTQSMEFTDRDGAAWLTYIEGCAQSCPERQPTSAAVLPARHLRFDSATESRFTASLPAGSPFLSEARLQSLLDAARSDPPPASTVGSPGRTLFGPGQRLARWVRAAGARREAIADWPRRWRQSARRQQAPGHHVLELLSGAADAAYGILAALSHRPARP